MKRKLTPKDRVVKKERNAYARLIAVGLNPSAVVISVSGTDRNIGIGFNAIEAWADAARRLK